MSRESIREIAAFLVIGFAAFLIVCIYSQSSADYLDGSERTANLGGPVGAAMSFHLSLWVGRTGAYGAAVILGLFGLCVFFRRRIKQWGWKVLGSVLAVLTLCSSEVAIFEGSGSPDVLPGGYYGQFLYSFLLGNLSSVGTYMILGLTGLVAFVISTDTVFYPAFSRSREALFARQRWSAVASLLKARKASRRFPRMAAVKNLLVGILPRRRRVSGEDTTRTERKRRGPGAPRERQRASGDPEDVAQGAGSSAGEDDPSAPEEAVDTWESEPEGVGTTTGVPQQAEFFNIPEPAAPRKAQKRGERRQGPYQLPSLSLIEPTPTPVSFLDKTALAKTASKIETTLNDFKIAARVVEIQKGPTITQFEISPAAGIKVHKITNLADDLAMALKAPSIRVIAPIPGKATVGIEVPNHARSMVGLRELIEICREKDRKHRIPLALGRDTAGNPVLGDLGDMPHLLIAGSTGSGKSVCINSIISSILMTRTPDEVKLILLDPKMVELAQFESIPHLLCPVVTDMKKAPAVLNWLVDRMDERYELLALAGVRHISSYNALGREKLRERLAGKIDDGEIEQVPVNLPSVVVIMDELADLMMTAAKEVEGSITRLSQKSRAVGIHVIVATQRPSVDVITGLIKANMPSRISFRVTSRVDSRTILDRNGAEKLLGKGDMLYTPPGTSDLVRVQGAFISDSEIRNVVQYVAREAEPQFNSELTRFGIDGAVKGEQEDELFEDAVRIVLGSQRGSVTLLQRQLQIGYTRASRLMELMHERGLVGPFKGSKAREVYYTLEEWDKSQGRKQGNADEGD